MADEEPQPTSHEREILQHKEMMLWAKEHADDEPPYQLTEQMIILLDLTANLPSHIPRDGEPKETWLLEYEDEEDIPEEEWEEYRTWRAWVSHQPDYRLFEWERTVQYCAQSDGGQLSSETIQNLFPDLGKVVHEERLKGHADLVEQYWPHWHKLFPPTT